MNLSRTRPALTKRRAMLRRGRRGGSFVAEGAKALARCSCGLSAIENRVEDYRLRASIVIEFSRGRLQKAGKGATVEVKKRKGE